MIRLEIAGQMHRAQASSTLFAPAAELIVAALEPLADNALVLCLEPGAPLLTHTIAMQAHATQARLVSVTKKIAKQGASGFPGQHIAGDTISLPLAAHTFDAVLGNLVLGDSGLDMVQLREMVRVLKPGGQFIATALVAGTLEEFYDTTRSVCERLKLHGSRAVLAGERAGQYDIDRLHKVCVACGVSGAHIGVEHRAWSFADGSAFINDKMVQAVFLADWLRTLLNPKVRANALAEVANELSKQMVDEQFYTRLVTAVVSGVKG